MTTAPGPEFAVKLRALRAAADNPTQEQIGRAVGRTHSTIGLILRGEHIPPWNTAVKIIEVLGGDPADFRLPWEASRVVPERVLRTPPVPVRRGIREFLVRHDRLGDDLREYLTGVTPDSVAGSLPPGKLAEYRISGAGGPDVSVWHACAGCTQNDVVHDVAQAVEWALAHELEVHSGGS